MVLHFQTDTLANKQVSFAVDPDLRKEVKTRVLRGNLSLKFKGNFQMRKCNQKLEIPPWMKLEVRMLLHLFFVFVQRESAFKFFQY